MITAIKVLLISIFIVSFAYLFAEFITCNEKSDS